MGNYIGEDPHSAHHDPHDKNENEQSEEYHVFMKLCKDGAQGKADTNTGFSGTVSFNCKLVRGLTGTSRYYTIAPMHLEILSEDPQIFMVHNLLTDAEIDALKKAADGEVIN